MALEQKQLEKALREQEPQYQALFEQTTDAVFILSLDQTILNVNPRAAAMLGYEVDKLIGRPITQIITPKEQRNSQRMFKALMIDHILPVSQCTFRRNDGTRIPVEIGVVLVNDKQNKPLYIQGIVRDITEQKQTEKALRESEARYCAVVEDQTELICRYHPNGILTFVNEAYCRYFGQRKEELLGRTFMSLIPKEDHEKVKKYILALNRKNPIILYEHRVIKPDGKLAWQQWIDRAILDEKGNITEYQAVGRDISTLKRAEVALRKTAEVFRQTFDALPDPAYIWMRQPDGRIILEQVNRVASDIYGKMVNKLLGVDLETLSKDTEAKSWLNWFGLNLQDILLTVRQVMNTGEIHHIESSPGRQIANEKWFIMDSVKAGEDRVLLVTKDITERKQAENLLRQARDELAALVKSRTAELVRVNEHLTQEIIERKQAEKALRESEEKYRELVEKLHDGVIAEDSEAIITFLNPRAAELLGYASDELIGQHVRITIPKEEELKIRNEATNRTRGISSSYETTLLKKTGETIPVQISATPLFLASGEFRGILSVFTDLSKLKKAQQELAHADKLAGLGRIAAGVAHELNNPLSFVYGNTEILGEYLDALMYVRDLQTDLEGAVAEGDLVKAQQILGELRNSQQLQGLPVDSEKDLPMSYIDLLRDAVSMQFENLEGLERMMKIIKDLRNFSRTERHDPRMQQCSVPDILRTTVNMVKYEFKSQISFDLLLDDLPPILGQPDRLTQAFLNIITNAAHATAGKAGKIEVIATTSSQDVCICIRDNGVGIPKKHQQKIFEPFFTTKVPGKGTGLGLAITHEIIRVHQGKISIESQVGIGTEVQVLLPISEWKNGKYADNEKSGKGEN
ncbi:MAG: PAS domain S-box protein [Candidatus Heimdallarchaeota archaeon]